MSVSLSGYRFPRVLLAVAAALAGLCAFATISFTPSESGGQWLLDDLFIDPFARR